MVHPLLQGFPIMVISWLVLLKTWLLAGHNRVGFTWREGLDGTVMDCP